MFRRKRPAAGPLVLIAAAAALALSTLACAKKETADTWQMQPPKLEVRDSVGARLQLRASDVVRSTSVLKSIVGDEFASLQFAPADRGLALSISSQCQNVDKKEFKFTDTLTTAEDVALISLLPPETLAPTGLKQDWVCQLKLRVTNPTGSQQLFDFIGLKISFGTGREAQGRDFHQTLDSQTDALRVKSEFKRRLICSTWWTDSSDSDLATMARTPKVRGLDTRSLDRQPLCSVIELSPKAKLLGFFRPAFPGPGVAWEREILIARDYLPNLFHQPILGWNIRNESETPQLFFVFYKTARVQFSALIQVDSSNNRFWTRPILAEPRFTVEGATEARETADGLYFRIGPKATARLTMHSNKDRKWISNYDFTRMTSRMLVTLENPIQLQTIANRETSVNLASATPQSLAEIPRDAGSTWNQVLLSGLVLTRETNTANVTELNMSVLEARRLGQPMTDARCLNPYGHTPCPE